MKDLPSAIRDRGSSIRNNSDRTARVYEKRNHSGRHVCVTRSGGSIHDLRGYNLNDQTLPENQPQRLRLTCPRPPPQGVHWRPGR
ncbi:peptidase inhibitor family I36 protein [Streptomyces africanus]|uniref:peptidase inhibitor family I36 protein n=1 Tax=Streptomyces africanus TaxID=231024 RepID=UPI0027D9167E|nr:peptidase inhibitor family I36 protein [Streptomyces africanus]